MKKRIKNILYSTKFIVILGLIIVPFVSFAFITISPESPLYTSISRIAWVHNLWLNTFIWALIIMLSIVWLTYRLVETSPLSSKAKKIIIWWQFLNILLVFIGCLMFPAKQDVEMVKLINYLHDYVTAIGWVLYGIGLIVYSILLRRKDKFLGFLGLGIMSFIIFSSIFFIMRVVDPTSYVGASAVSEVYIINSLYIFLVFMYVAQEYNARLGCKKNLLEEMDSKNGE